MASFCAVVMRGGKNPRVVESSWRTAEATGAAVPMPTLPAKYAFPVVVAPPRIVSPPVCAPLPMVEDAVAKMFVRNDVPETVMAVEEAYVITPFVEKKFVAVSAVDDAYGNVLATLVEVAMKYGAVGVEVDVMVPELLTHSSELAMPASESAPAESKVLVALPPKYALLKTESCVEDARMAEKVPLPMMESELPERSIEVFASSESASTNFEKSSESLSTATVPTFALITHTENVSIVSVMEPEFFVKNLSVSPAARGRTTVPLA